MKLRRRTLEPVESLADQIDRLATHILALDCGYPNRDGGAVDAALRMIDDYREALRRIATYTGSGRSLDPIKNIARRALVGKIGP